MYALIANGTVIQIETAKFPVHPDFLWVPVPSGMTVEVGYGATQSGGVWTFTTPPTPPAPTLAQQARSLIAGGLSITSTGTPALNGTYTVASGVPFGREDIQTEAQFVSTFSEFTNGTTTLDWPLIDGTTTVTFPTTAAFLNVAKAAGQFYAAAMSVARAGTGALPSASVTIP